MMKTGKHGYSYLDFYGPKQVVDTTINSKGAADTIYHTIHDFTLVDLSGGIVSFEKYNPSYWIFHFFNTGCKEPCSDVFRNLYDVVRDFKEAPKVKFFSITTQPFNDSLPALIKHEKANGILAPQWLVCTGDSLSIDSLMRKSFFLNGNSSNAALNQVFLVDPDKHLRGIYDGSDLMDMRRLKDEIKVLSYETKQKE